MSFAAKFCEVLKLLYKYWKTEHHYTKPQYFVKYNKSAYQTLD